MNNEERINATLGQLALYACTGAFTCEQDDVALFIKRFLQLEDQAELAEAWNARYGALLEQVETSRPKEYRGDGEDLPSGTIVLDREGDAWQHALSGVWWCAAGGVEPKLYDGLSPYTIVYTPKEES